MAKQIQLFEASKMTLPEAIEESLDSLNEYGSRFPHWVSAFSGGKDSAAATTLVGWAIRSGRVKAPETFTVLYSDTGMELTPLWLGAMSLLKEFERDGFTTKIVGPDLDNRTFVYMLGRGVPPANSGRRWCTRILKGDPMIQAVKELPHVNETMFITGVRLGESRSRDERIAVSCSSDGGECGQGWFQDKFNWMGVASLAPIVHWRVCNVFDWLYFEQDTHGYKSVDGIATVYGDEEIRTGCAACFVIEEDRALKRVAAKEEWSHLGTLAELYDVYEYLNRHENRLRMPLSVTKSGTYAKKTGVIGPIKMEARQHALEWVLDIQSRADIILIDGEQEARIRELWTQNTWPDGWTGEEPSADLLLPVYTVLPDGESYTIQYPLAMSASLT